MKKQIIFIMTDTQRWDMVNEYKPQGLSTPCLDKLCQEGIRYSHAYTCQPVCGPARSAIFTGTFPHSNGSWGNTMPLGDNVKTIGQRLSDEGVKCGYIGKYHLDGGDYFGNGICPQGWDGKYWYDMRNYLDELTPEERRASRKPELMDYVDVPEDFTFGYRVTMRAQEFISEHKDEDFFLVVSYDEPHGPYICPKKYVDMYEDYSFPENPNMFDNLNNKPSHQQIWAGDAIKNRKELNLNRKYFFACNTFVDKLIGDVVDSAQENADDAMIIYTSDHGDAIESHYLSGKGPCVYDEIARIPFIIKSKQQCDIGVDDSPVTHIDIVPTIMDYFSLKLPTLLEGKSMLEQIKTGKPTNDEVFIEFGRYEIDHDGFGGFQPIRAACDGRFKLCINLLSSDELYDTLNDPNEMNNLINDNEYIEKRNYLHDRILKWMDDTRDPFRGYWWENRHFRQDAPQPIWDCHGKTRQREDADYSPKQLDYSTGIAINKLVRDKVGRVGELVIPKSLEDKTIR